MADFEMADGWQAQVAPQVLPCMEELAKRMEARAKEMCPVAECGDPHPPGELLASVYADVVGEDIILGARAPYACDVELGTFPHLIVRHPPGKSLRNSCTGFNFGRIVHHPGATPSPFLRPQCHHWFGDLS